VIQSSQPESDQDRPWQAAGPRQSGEILLTPALQSVMNSFTASGF